MIRRESVFCHQQIQTPSLCVLDKAAIAKLRSKDWALLNRRLSDFFTFSYVQTTPLAMKIWSTACSHVMDVNNDPFTNSVAPNIRVCSTQSDACVSIYYVSNAMWEIRPRFRSGNVQYRECTRSVDLSRSA
jgi:hypothetical protein